mgnify:CR=1 FL=1
MSFDLNNFINYLDQVKDKDWIDDHLVIDGLDKDTANKIKDKIRERLIDEQLPTTESNEKRKV